MSGLAPPAERGGEDSSRLFAVAEGAPRRPPWGSPFQASGQDKPAQSRWRDIIGGGGPDPKCP